MTDDERDGYITLAVFHLRRIADALERISPPVADRRKMTPAGPEALSRPTLADQAQWENEEADQRTRTGSLI